MTDIKDIAQIVQSVATVVAVMIGAAWFIIKRKYAYRVSISQEINHWNLGNGKYWIRVTVTINNQGDVQIKLRKGFTELQQIKPIALKDIEKAIAKGKDPVQTNLSYIIWPHIQRRELDGDYNYREIEPSEKEEIHVDFIIDDYIEIVQAYTCIENDKKIAKVKKFKMTWWWKVLTFLPSNFFRLFITRNETALWSKTTVYDLKPSGEAANIIQSS